MQTLSLNGTWKLTYRDQKLPGNIWGRWINAQVPGDVHLDLMNAGIIPEALIEDNTQKMEWIEEKDWWYQKTFSVENLFKQNKVELIFEGIDLTADIWLNGTKIGHTNNMFCEYRFDVTEFLCEGLNVIDVRVDVGFAAAQNKPTDRFEHCWNTWDVRRFWMRKATQSFFWDIAPRLLTCGIWKDVRLESYESAVIRDVYLSHTSKEDSADIKFEVELESFQDGKEYSLSAEVKDESGKSTASMTIPTLEKGKHCMELSVHLDSVKLWWPNGVGEPHLYQVKVVLHQGVSAELSSKSLRYGIRDIQLEQKGINSKESTFTFLVNGKRVYMKGGDWVPEDSIYARITKESTYDLVKLAHDGNYNMFRVWGGGIYPSDAFYDACDELGILVWQDFMFACGYYPDFDSEFYEEVSREVECVIRKYRNHAAVGLWCGNNENMQMFDEMQIQMNDTIHYGLKIYEEIIPNALKKLDPNNLYWPSSPFGGEDANSSCRGDQHVWDYSMAWLANGSKQLEIWGFADEDHKFVSEFGIEAPPNLSSARKYMGHLPIYSESHEWYHHMCYYAVGLIQNLLLRYYKDEEVTDLTEYTLAGQMIQAEAIKDVLDSLRSKMYVCSGTLYWQYNESWGHTGYAPLDYYKLPKASYYYMQRAFSPINVVFSAKGDGIVVYNDSLDETDATVIHGIQDFSGNFICREEKKCGLKGSTPIYIEDVSPQKEMDPKSCFKFAEIYAQGKRIASNRKFLTDFKELQLPAEAIQANIYRVSDCDWTIELSAEKFMWDVTILPEDSFTVSDNSFDLWPNEKKTLYVHTKEPMACFRPEIISINHYLGGNNIE